MTSADYRGCNPLIALDDIEVDVLLLNAGKHWRSGETFDEREKWRKRYEQLQAMKTGIRVTEAA